MTFELTDKLTDSIISAMDNQEKIFVVNAAAGQLVEEIQPDEENFYRLPEWKSADGFAMREEFVSTLHAPLVHDELMAVLHSGRGVFKNFRTILKGYPEIDKRWHIFKNRYMSARINEWYNSLREVWGLEKLDYITESDNGLVHDDFSFEEYESEIYKNEVLSNITAGIYEDERLPSEVKKVINEMWRNQFEQAEAATQTGYICRSLSEDFAGCITASSITETQEKVMFITSLFVPEQFRGLGIGTELISMCISKLQSMDTKFIIMPNIIVPEIIQPLLIRTGFEKINSGYLLAL